MKIWTLAENTALNDGFSYEHGLSLYIESNGIKILFDAGQTDVFIQNARKLGVALKDVDVAILSHGHYDHGGGLTRFLEINSKAPVYISRHAFAPHHNALGKDIGLNPSLLDCNRVILTEGSHSLTDNILLTHCGDCPVYEPIMPCGLTAVLEGKTVAEDFRHEQYLCIRENGKTVVFSGCSHRGVLNIAQWLSPDILIGGFHFSTLDPADPFLEQAARKLGQRNTRYYTCHCTGQAQFQAMKAHLGDQLSYLSAGTTLSI